MTDEYIKREDALDIVADNNVTGEITLNRYDKIIDGIYEIPSADVAQVRHGHWRLVSRLDEVEWLYGAVIECSQCKHEEVSHYKYCPNCGAKMDGGTDFNDFCSFAERKDNGRTD